MDSRSLWTRLAVSTALAVSAAGATAQTPPPAPPKFYPGTITPNPAVTPPKPTTGAGATPAKSGIPPAGGAPAKPKPLPLDGVRLIGATDADLPRADPPRFAPPTLVAPPAGGDAVPAPLPLPGSAVPTPAPTPPVVTAERSSAPLAIPTPGATPPAASDRSPPTSLDQPLTAPLVAPAPPATPLPGVPTASAVGSKQAPAVTVEYEMPESVGIGQPLTYTLVVTNTGTSAVSHVRVEQEVPAGVTFVSSDPPAESGDGKLAWQVGGLEASTERRVKVTVKPAEEGEVRGRATVSFATAVEAKVKVTRPRIGVSLTAAETARVGDKVVFTIKLTNTGTGPANSMTLHARLSDGLGHPAGNVIEAPLSNLPAGQTKTLTLEATAAKAGGQQCALTVYADTNPAETAKANVTLVEPLLTAKQAGPAKCLVKAEPVYQIELSNPGTAATDPLTMWTLIPEGFEFVSATDGGAFAATNKLVVWKLAGLPAGTTKTVGVKLKSTAPSEGVVRTLIQTGAGEPAGGVTQAAAKGKPLEAKCETTVKAEGVPGLRFEVADLDDPVEVGKEAVYEIKVTNQGTGPCTNVAVVAELGDGTVAGATAGPTAGRVTGATVSFDPLAQLPVKGDVTYKVRVKGTAAGDTRIRVRLSCDQIKTAVSKEEGTRFYKE